MCLFNPIYLFVYIYKENKRNTFIPTLCVMHKKKIQEKCENPILNRVATIKLNKMAEQKQVQSKTTMILISFFLGGLGIHRLMMGYSNWWLMLITAGGCGIWALVDFIRIITGSMKMADGRDLV